MWDGKLKAVTFSFDDGITQDIKLIELLNKYNLKATFNINSELLGKKGMLIRGEGQKISHYKIHPDDVKEIYAGHEAAVHTLTHPNLTGLEENEIIRQVEEDRKNLEAIVGYPIEGMAYPCGGVNNDDRVAAVIKEKTKIKYSRTITSSYSFDLQDNLYRFNPTLHFRDWEKLFESGEKFLKNDTDEPQLYYIWGHSYEFDIDNSWHRVEEFFKMISGYDNVFYGTNKEVLL